MTINILIHTASVVHGVTAEGMKGKSRKHAHVYARANIINYVNDSDLRDTISHKDLVDELNLYDCSIVRHAIEMHNDVYMKIPSYRRKYETFKKLVGLDELIRLEKKAAKLDPSIHSESFLIGFETGAQFVKQLMKG